MENVEIDLTDDLLQAIVVLAKNKLEDEVTKESLSGFSDNITTLEELKQSIGDVYVNELFTDVVKAAILDLGIDSSDA